MTTWIVVSASILAVLAIYTLFAPAAVGVLPFLQRRKVACPKHGVYTDVKLNGLAAALSTAYGRPRLRVSGCELRPRGTRCKEDCLEDES